MSKTVLQQNIYPSENFFLTVRCCMLIIGLDLMARKWDNLPESQKMPQVVPFFKMAVKPEGVGIGDCRTLKGFPVGLGILPETC